MDNRVIFNKEVIRRYDTFGPRYTSYPTAVQFSTDYNADDYKGWIQCSNEDLIPAPLSLYLHIPFCDTICYYCGCSKIVTKANLSLRETAINDAAQSIKFLKNELEKTDVVEVRRAIYSVMEQQLQQIMLANVREQFAFKVIDPAVAPEPDDFVAPRRLLIVVVATVLGGGLAVLYILLSGRLGQGGV